APFAIDADDAAELSVRRRVVSVVLARSDGERGAEVLVAALVLRLEQLGLAQPALERGEKMRQRLGVAPDVRAAAGAGAGIVVATLPQPEASVGLTQHGGRFQDRKVRRRGPDRLGRQRRVIER